MTLATTAKFRDLLGPDGQVNVSALVYTNIAPIAKSASAVLPNGAGNGHGQGGQGGPAQLAKMLVGQGPTLYYAYAEPDRIVFAGSNQNPLGLNLGTLASFGGMLGGMHRGRGRRSLGTANLQGPGETIMSNSPVIELQGLEVRFGGRPILKGLNASLSGRCIGLLGPNGAGKTTLLHTLLGFHPPSAGTARIFGKDIQTGGAGDPRPDGLHARERRLHRRHDRGALRPADGGALRAPLGAVAGARPRGALLRRPRRGPLPQGRDLLAGHEAARQAGPGAGPRAAAASSSTSRPTASIPTPASGCCG